MGQLRQAAHLQREGFIALLLQTSSITESYKSNETASTCGTQLQIEHCVTFKFSNNERLLQSCVH